MADLSFQERQQLEKCLQMESGYVLDFSNRTLQEFVQDAVSKDIYDADYDGKGNSKANRLRVFFQNEPNHVVGVLVDKLVQHARSMSEPPNEAIVVPCVEIASRLKQAAPVLGHIQLATTDTTFAALSRSIRNSIETNRPQEGLDRLHTFFVSYLRDLCKKHGVDAAGDSPAHGLLGLYIKVLKSKNCIESNMTEKILRYALGTMDPFNHVRNNQSLAHPNLLLNYDEALLIYNHVVAVVNFIRAVERRLDGSHQSGRAELNDFDIPF